MDRRCVLGWLNEVYRHPTVAFNTYSDEQQMEFAHDALVLLKEHEAVKPKSKVRHGAYAQIQHFCGNCNAMLHGKPKFCSSCGRGVKWE